MTEASEVQKTVGSEADKAMVSTLEHLRSRVADAEAALVLAQEEVTRLRVFEPKGKRPVLNRKPHAAPDLKHQLRERVLHDILMHPERYNDDVFDDTVKFAQEFADHFIEKCDAQHVRVLNELTADALASLTQTRPSVRGLYDYLYGGEPLLGEPGSSEPAPKFRGC